MVEGKELVKWFSELSNKDVEIAGGKGASLAEMYTNKFPIPPGFVVTAQAYKYFIEKAGIKDKIKEKLDGLDVNDTAELGKRAEEIRKLIIDSDMPKDLEEEIVEAYDALDADKKEIGQARGSALDILKNSHEPPFVAVRSSATAEDLVDASFAGQQESFLNVKGNQEVIKKVQRCFASLFTARAVYYREKKGFDHSKVYLAAVVQKMVASDKSGVMFSRNPIGKPEEVMIEAVWGLGEGIVSGKIKPDNYLIDRESDDLKILKKEISEKKTAIVRDSSGDNKEVRLSSERSKQEVLSGYELKRLTQYAKQLEEHYEKPQDIEFAIEGNDIFIVQSRPITTLGKNSGEVREEFEGKVLLSGMGASPGVSSGVVRIIHDLSELDRVQNGNVLVTKMTNPDMVVSMQKASGIVTDEGGVTSHAAIVSREMGIPAVVGTGDATQKLKDGDIVTVDGSHGKVFEGKGETKKLEIKEVVPTKTKIKVIVDLPDYAERAAKSKVRSVGLVRLEGIIASSGKHPMYFVKEKNMGAYTEIIASGIKKIAEYFDEVWVRSSDLRSDEYRNLVGAPKEIEGNPMLGDHGIRYSLRHPEIFEAEVKGMKEVADELGDKKFGIMVPQVIGVSDLIESKRIAKEIGIPNNVKLGIMIETPAAVQIIKDLCEEGMDFISFGTNDLTQYTLAVDRNNESVQYLYDELHPGVLNSLKYVIRTCKKYRIMTSICGQAASKPEMAKFLVKEGIDSLSVNADAAAEVSKVVAGVESRNLSGEVKRVDDPKGEVVMDRPEEKSKDGFDESKVEGIKTGAPVISAAPSFGKDQEEIDMEDAILKELEREEFSEMGKGIQAENRDEYFPGGEVDKKGDIPPLSESMSIESNLEGEKEGENVLDIGSDEKESDEKEKVVDILEEELEKDLNEEVEKQAEFDLSKELTGGNSPDELMGEREEKVIFGQEDEWGDYSYNGSRDKVVDIF
jgi:pyruvate, water dikinase